MSKTEAQLAELKKELHTHARNQEEFIQWKLNKSKLMSELKAKSKQLDRWNNVNVDRLILGLKKKDQELQSLKNFDQISQKKLDLMEDKKQKELKELTRQLNEEKKMKVAAISKVESLLQENEFLKKKLNLPLDINAVNGSPMQDEAQQAPLSPSSRFRKSRPVSAPTYRKADVISTTQTLISEVSSTLPSKLTRSGNVFK